MINQEFVYHCSKTKGLKRLEPKPSTHKTPWIYATKDISISAMFLGDNFDFICQIGIEDGIPYISERFEGSFEYAYKGKSGSLYYLKPDTFLEGKTSWSPEIVSEVAVDVIKEQVIEDVYEFLLTLEKEKKVIIYRYPKHAKCIPEDKSDIVKRGVDWTIDFGEKILEQVEQYHPDMLNQVLKNLSEKGYKFKDKKWKNLK